MAATVVVERDVSIGQTEHLYWGTIVPGSYATNGVVVDVSGNASFEKLVTGCAGGYGTSWDQANQKLKIYRQKDPGNAGGADIPLPEVANATDLSGVTFHFIAVGE